MVGQTDLLLKNINVQKILKDTEHLKLGFVWIRTKKVFKGSKVRRPGRAYVDSWKNELRGNGFSRQPSHYVSVYCE